RCCSRRNTPMLAWVSSLAIARATRKRLSMSSSVERMNWPRVAVSGWLFFSLVAHIGPQGIQLAALDLEVAQQDGLDLLGMLSRFPQPGQNRIFLETLGA